MEKKTILIADDETHILSVLSMKLTNAGYNVVTAEDGADAYAQACTVRPDLIITDYQMPMLSGVELCSKLQSDPQMCNIPAILLTARGFSISNSEMALGNIKQVIDKPFSPREVLVYVQKLLAQTSAGLDVTQASV